MPESLHRYQDVYPSDPLLRSFDVVRPRAGELLNLEYFEADPASMPTEVFAQHHLLLNLQENAHRVENWRGSEHRDFTFRLNEVVITPAGIRSGWRWHAKSKVIVITIEPDRLARFARNELALPLSSKQLKDVPQALDADLVQAGKMVLDALQVRSSGSEVMFESFARIFLVKLLQSYGDALDSSTEGLQFSKSFTSAHYKKVLDYIAVRYSGPIAIEDLARIAGMSPAHFSRLFKEVLGDSPYQFVMDFRVEQAKKMLKDADRPLSDIALSCGFSDQPHFTRVFKQLIGVTPKAFRALG